MLQWEHSAILLTFIKLPFVIKIFVLSFLSGCLRHILKCDVFTTKKDGSTGPTALETDGPYFEIMGQ